MPNDIDQNELRAWAGAILLILALAYIYLRTQNGNIEYIMIGLAAFLVGGALFGGKNTP